ncbi:MAG: hypothetical protein BWY08_00265 [Bacteroidetes bacterium ADurb.Bin174]|jgi:hypothetical protein|nr:MAG: hypothetical protein BWY08_00265 [Bacteroidetes bacterium ADurb.Bin174]
MALLLTYSLNYTRSRYITHPQTQAGNLSTTTQPYGRFESVNAQRKKYPSKFVFRWVFFCGIYNSHTDCEIRDEKMCFYESKRLFK